MKKSKIETLINALGKGHRDAYLEQNPHGYTSVKKVHKSKKKYTRKKKHKNDER